VNGWVFKEALPKFPGNFACCTIRANAQSIVESAELRLEVTNSSIAVESMIINFNFNNYTDPVVITDGGGFNRLSLTFRFGGAQHFRYNVTVFPGIPNPDDFSYAVFLPDELAFDPLGEENFNGCADGICDGVSDVSGDSCAVTISGPTMRRNQVIPRNAVIEPSDPFSGTVCDYKVFIVTQGQKVKLTNGVQIYDNIAESLFPENLGEQLEPIGCP
jgi:hypothetical protein